MVKSARFDVTFSIFIENSFFSAFSAFSSLSLFHSLLFFVHHSSVSMLMIPNFFLYFCFHFIFTLMQFHSLSVMPLKYFLVFALCVLRKSINKRAKYIDPMCLCVCPREQTSAVARSREMHSIANCYKTQKEEIRRKGEIERDTQMRFQMFFSSFQLPFACSVH